jgi:hypothetical protein
MSDIDPPTLAMFAYVAAGIGLVQLVVGVALSRSTEPTRPAISWLLQSDGAAFMAAAAVCYFANSYDWAFKAAIATLFVVFFIGYMIGMKAGKARGAWK